MTDLRPKTPMSDPVLKLDGASDFIFQKLKSFLFTEMPKSRAVIDRIQPQLSRASDGEMRAFFDEALTRVSESDARTVTQGLSAGSIDLPNAVQSLFQKVQAVIDDEFLRSFYGRVFAHGYGALFDRFATVVNDPAAKANSAGTVVAVSRKCYNLLQREALYLRKNGYRVFLVNLSPILPELRPAFDPSFDLILDGINFYIPLGLLIERLEPDIFHVEGWMWEYSLVRFVDEHKRAGKLVCEFYDVTSIYAAPENLAKVFWDDLVDLDLAMERYIFHRADGIVHRFPPEVIDRAGVRHGACPPQIEMHQYACPEYIRYADPPGRADDGKLRLVYIGGLIPRSAEHPPEMFPEWGHPEAWRHLLEQGFEIDVYNSLFRGLGEPAMEVFHNLAKEYPEFRLLPGVPQDKLAETISGYDFGLILAEMDRSISWCSDDQFDHCVGTKLFAYLEAGLPVIVNAEYGYMTEILERDGMGFGLHSSELATAGPRVCGFDRQGAVEKIKAFNAVHGMDNEIHRLIGLYEAIREH